MYKIMLASATSGFQHTEFTTSLLSATIYTYNTFYDKLDGLSYQVAESSSIPRNRSVLAKLAIENNYSHIIYLDEDMEFPEDSFVRLIKHDKPVVGINYTIRKSPFRQFTSNIKTTEDSSGLEEVAIVANGLTCIKTEVFKQLPKPWFMFAYQKKRDDYTTEDVWICSLLRENGIPIFVDHDLTKEVYHIGKYKYGWNSPRKEDLIYV